jgi:hypothetical protein
MVRTAQAQGRVWFRAIVDEKCIDCGISLEALRDHFGAYYDDPCRLSGQPCANRENRD